MDVLILLVYLAGLVLAPYPISRFLIEVVVGEDKPTRVDNITSAAIACLASLIWPVYIAAALLYHTSRMIWRLFSGR